LSGKCPKGDGGLETRKKQQKHKNHLTLMKKQKHPVEDAATSEKYINGFVEYRGYGTTYRAVSSIIFLK
jgi:hypothetical protein